MDSELALYIAAAVALVSVVALIVVLVRTSRERQRLMKEYEDAEDELQERLLKMSSEKAAVESKLAASEEYEARMREVQDNALKMQKEQHEKDLDNMRDAFKALSAENSAVFKKQSAESIGELLKPIREKFTEFGDAVRESRKEALQQNAELKEHIRGVMDRSNAVGEEARNLANALTGYSKVQGDFGEMLLTDVLKNSGLQEGVHFFTQGVMTDSSGHEIKSESGRTMIPDVMVFYPDDTTVIIDSKVSLNAYKDWMNAEKVEDRKRLAKAHVESVRKHVDELKTKDYASYIPADRRKVNYNLMFIPVEGAFRLMLEEDPMLWQVAKDNNVLIVSQMTLIIVLNMIQMAWKQANQEKNIAEVYKTAEELMSQLNGWMANYVKIGESLEKAMSSFEESTSKLKDSNQSVMKKIQKLEKLGLSPKRSQARIKTSGRTQGPESIIPESLTPAGDDLEA
ncbi:MAG: DNA recombination protein RmuC [Candidatus Cryptobacteroides sp.]|jgi:DNA recombination protein RmuC|nr:DNA recombination protein RmuC [Candidatus Cryptobacteroides sp.]